MFDSSLPDTVHRRHVLRALPALGSLQDASSDRPPAASGRRTPAVPRQNRQRPAPGRRTDELREQQKGPPLQQTDNSQRKTRVDEQPTQPDAPDSDGPGPSRSQEPPSGPSPDREDAEAESKLPLDQVFEILKNSRRRETLQYLRTHDGSATLSEVAEHIAALENDTTVQAISSTQRKRVYVGLYQCHLPKMDDIGVVDFDKNRGTIELKPVAEQLFEYLEDDDSRDWHWLYLTIALAGAGLFVLALAGAASYGLTPAVVLGGLLVAVTGCSVAQALAAQG
jgi:hypothetical protein